MSIYFKIQALKQSFPKEYSGWNHGQTDGQTFGSIKKARIFLSGGNAGECFSDVIFSFLIL